jgi:hypothetical protein
MKIHSSSLNLPIGGLNQKLGKNGSAQNNNEQSVEKDVQNKKSNLPASTIEEIKKTLDAIDSTSKSNSIKPTDTRTLKALSAYSQEFNAPQQAQLAESLTGIDAYA